MPVQIGTRIRANRQFERVDQGEPNGVTTRDKGMTKNISASVTFNSGTGRATAANGTFAAFAAGDTIEVTKSPSNTGFFTVTGIDAANSAYLVLDPPPVTAGAATVNIRTP